jgi:hypothetical protein
MTETYSRRIEELKSAVKGEKSERFVYYHAISYHTIYHYLPSFLIPLFCRSTLQEKRDSLSKDAGDFKSDYSSYMMTMSDTIQTAKLEHVKLTERVRPFVSFLK